MDNNIQIYLPAALFAIGLVWAIIKWATGSKTTVQKKTKSKPKAKPVFEHIEEKTTGDTVVEKRQTLSAEKFKEKNNGVPAGMPASFAVRD